MQLPDEVKKLVFFVEGQGGGESWVGTGFFVFDDVGLTDAKGARLPMIYAVTARHCVQQIDPDEDPPVESIRLLLSLDPPIPSGVEQRMTS